MDKDLTLTVTPVGGPGWKDILCFCGHRALDHLLIQEGTGQIMGSCEVEGCECLVFDPRLRIK